VPIEGSEDLFPMGICENRHRSCSSSAWDASASSRETAAIGRPYTSLQAFTVVNPTRNPVNDPGPEAAA